MPRTIFSTTACFVAPIPQPLRVHISTLLQYWTLMPSHEGDGAFAASLNRWLTIYPCPYRLSVLPNQGASVIIELDHHAVWPLNLLGCSHHYSVPYVPSPYLSRSDRSGATTGACFAQVSRFLDDHDDPIACLSLAYRGDAAAHGSYTDPCMPFHFEVCDALDNGSSRIVDAVKHRLSR